MCRRGRDERKCERRRRGEESGNVRGAAWVGEEAKWVRMRAGSENMLKGSLEREGKSKRNKAHSERKNR